MTTRDAAIDLCTRAGKISESAGGRFIANYEDINRDLGKRYPYAAHYLASLAYLEAGRRLRKLGEPAPPTRDKEFLAAMLLTYGWKPTAWVRRTWRVYNSSYRETRKYMISRGYYTR